MSTTKFIPALLLFMLSSCITPIKVTSYSDKSVDFVQYKTYAFITIKNSNTVPISSIDKKIILQAIETELEKKAMTKSKTPDLLIGFFASKDEKTSYIPYYGRWDSPWDINQNYMSTAPTNISERYNSIQDPWQNTPKLKISIKGKLFIGIIDPKLRKVIWQGKGEVDSIENLSQNEILLNKYVSKILAQYPTISMK